MAKSKTRVAYWLVWLSLCGLCMALPFAMPRPYHVHVMAMSLFWGYLASAWNIIGGFGGQLSLGHGVYTAIGAYVTVLLFSELGITPWIGMWVGAALAVLVSQIVGYPTFRLRGAYYALATVAFAEGVVVILENTTSLGGWHTGGAEGLVVPLLGEAPAYFQFNSKVPYYFIALTLLAAVVIASRAILRSPLGYQLRAVKDDEEAAAASGVDVRRVKLMAAAISAFFTAIGGSFYAQMIRYLEPVSIGGAAMSTQMVFMAIVGGRGTVAGPVIGGVLLTLLGEGTRALLGGKLMGLHLFLYGVLVMLTVIYQPQGLMGLSDRVLGWLRLRDAKAAGGF